jgi:hypothetical protein
MNVAASIQMYIIYCILRDFCQRRHLLSLAKTLFFVLCNDCIEDMTTFTASAKKFFPPKVCKESWALRNFYPAKISMYMCMQGFIQDFQGKMLALS